MMMRAHFGREQSEREPTGSPGPTRYQTRTAIKKGWDRKQQNV